MFFISSSQCSSIIVIKYNNTQQISPESKFHVMKFAKRLDLQCYIVPDKIHFPAFTASGAAMTARG